MITRPVDKRFQKSVKGDLRLSRGSEQKNRQVLGVNDIDA